MSWVVRVVLLWAHSLSAHPVVCEVQQDGFALAAWLLVPTLPLLPVVLDGQGSVARVWLHVVGPLRLLTPLKPRVAVLSPLSPAPRDYMQAVGQHLALSRVELPLRLRLVRIRAFVVGAPDDEYVDAVWLEAVWLRRAHRHLVPLRHVLVAARLAWVVLHEVAPEDRLVRCRGSVRRVVHVAVRFLKLWLLVTIVQQPTLFLVVRSVALVVLRLVEPHEDCPSLAPCESDAGSSTAPSPPLAADRQYLERKPFVALARLALLVVVRGLVGSPSQLPVSQLARLQPLWQAGVHLAAPFAILLLVPRGPPDSVACPVGAVLAEILLALLRRVVLVIVAVAALL